MPLLPWLARLVLLLLPACATAPPAERLEAAPTADRSAVVRAATEMIGAPYRYGGRSPRGFDCSGLVLYSYAKAGLDGLPHSAARLSELATPISLEELEAGDLLFFELSGRKTSHVGIYVGERAFVHAPSSGKRVESVSLEDVYWSGKLKHAGRLIR